jgi:hypothetical protein
MGAFAKIKDGMAFAFRRPPWRNSARPTASTSCCRTAAASATKTDGRPQPVVRHGHAKPETRRRAPQRPGGLAPVQARYRRRPAGALGISPAEINSVLATAWGSSYVNDFIENGRVKKVFLQAAAEFRMLPEDIGPLAREKQPRRNGAVLRVLLRPLAVRLAPPGALQRHPVRPNHGPGRPRHQHRRGHGRDGKMAASSRKASASSGPDFPTRKRTPAPRPRALCDLAAGRFPQRGRSLRKLDHSLREPADDSAGPRRRDHRGHLRACPTTSISRSACSPPSASPPRTPS